MVALQEIVRILEKVKFEHEIKSVLHEITNEMQAANIAYIAETDTSMSSHGRIWYVTYSEEWEKRYQDREYLRIDPVERGMRGSLPFDWHAVANAGSTRWFFLEAENFGVGRQGVSIPLRGRAGERALITLTSFQSNREWQTTRWHYQTLISALAPYLHELTITLREVHSKEITLSRRQHQCLELYGRGVSAKEIAARLGISGSMTREHLHRARRKMGSMTILSAAFKVARKNIISM